MTHSVFLPLEQLGILENRMYETFTWSSKRKRQVALRSVARLLKELELIPSAKVPLAIARGINSLGDLGYWIIFEGGFATSPKDAKTSQVEAQGPKALQCTCPTFPPDSKHLTSCPLYMEKY